MLLHYIKIAFRNLWKYKTQSIISIVGLAVGFTCFALSVFWIRYETTYDSFHEGADRMYIVEIPSIHTRDGSGYSRVTAYQLAGYLKENFPEIEGSTNSRAWKDDIIVDNVKYENFQASADSAFLRFFNIKILKGNADFTIPSSNNIALTEEKAFEIFGNEDPLGQVVLNWGDELKVTAIVSTWTGHSNIPYSMLSCPVVRQGWNQQDCTTIIKLRKNIDVKAFEEKLFAHVIDYDDRQLKEMRIIPLTKYRYMRDEFADRKVKFYHVVIFSIAGCLVIASTLFNYITLFLSRFRIRRKEFAIRVVSGSSFRSLFWLLNFEFILTSILSTVLGLLFIHTILASYLELAEIKSKLDVVSWEIFIYFLVLIFFALFIFGLSILLFRKKSLMDSVRGRGKTFYRNLSIAIQAMIGVGFIFCTIVLVKQIYYLQHTDLGFDFQNKGSFVTYDNQFKVDDFKKTIEEIPEITKVSYHSPPLIPNDFGSNYSNVSDWDGKKQNEESIRIQLLEADQMFVDIYNLRFIEGSNLLDDDQDGALINEAALKAFGWESGVGKKFFTYSKNYIVKGVVKDIYNYSPTTPSHPILLRNYSQALAIQRSCIVFEFLPGTWNIVENKINKSIKDNYSLYHQRLDNAEEAYNKYLQSETALMKLLGFIAFVCIIICILGFISIISLTCEERRKEIAIRKVNGATVKNILLIFIKEYFLLLFVGATISFSISYYIMKQWLEQYVKQTTISAWIYLAVLFVLILIIIICIGSKVYKTSRENPADVLKKE
ncbi:FtsX-like permease family protein [Bacteroidales bacterium OttesenSCG-928-M11]|nr:FtsX-like permease family protein [Bacteroidales bacterium OttesenSCG-928-M11]